MLGKQRNEKKCNSDRKWEGDERTLVWAVQEVFCGEVPNEMSLDIQEEPVSSRSGKRAFWAQVQELQSP